MAEPTQRRRPTGPSPRGTTLVRPATGDDIDRLVEVELETFGDVYDTHPADPGAIRQMLVTRLEVVQGLMIVGEVDGVIEGVMACQRTDKGIEAIKSWEETTNFGTLVGTHDPSGKNFYVVNLAVTERGSARNLSDQLIAMMLGIFIAAQAEEAQLLSRIPQFSQWLDECRIDFADLAVEVQDKWADEYVGTTRVVDGRKRLYDGVLQRYVDVGVRPRKLLRDGYSDPKSLNYSVVCTLTNPLPAMLRSSRFASRLIGGLLSYASNHPRILRMLP